MLPRVGMQPMQNNLAATPSPTAPGTTVTASGSINTKGAWAQIIASTDHPVCGVTLNIVNDSTSGDVVKNLYDLGIGGSGSEATIISNILSSSGTTTVGFASHFIPIFIPKGSRIAMRKQSSVASKTGSVILFLHQGFTSPPWHMFSGGDGIGIDLSTSGGTLHTPGSTGTESSWQNIGSPLARTYAAIIPTVSMGTDTDMQNAIGHLEIGVGGTTLAETIFVSTNSEAIGRNSPNIPIIGRWDAGMQLQVRAEVNVTADADIGVAFLGLY
jgi:hypothetical protein